MKSLQDIGRAVLPAIALGLVSAVASLPASNALEGMVHPEGGLVAISDLPHLDDLDELAQAVAAQRVPSAEEIAKLRPVIDRVAHRYGLDPRLLHAVIRAESGYNPNALSARGAIGLMQLLPGTGRRYGVEDLFDPRANVEAGARYLRYLLRLFQNDLELALAGYNAGEGSVIRAGNQIPNYPQTLAYVPKVLDYYRAAGGGS